MQSLHKILKEFVKGIGIESGAALNAVRRHWVDIIGAPIAVHTSPEIIKSRVLTIIVDTPQWMHHLSFFKQDISEKLKPYDIDGVRFRLGRLPEKADVPSGEEKYAELSEEDSRFVENTIKNIKDQELKEKFKKLIVHGLTKGKRKGTV